MIIDLSRNWRRMSGKAQPRAGRGGTRGKEHQECFPVQNSGISTPDKTPDGVKTPRSSSGAAEGVPIPAGGPKNTHWGHLWGDSTHEFIF